jgi:hypothetical protein
LALVVLLGGCKVGPTWDGDVELPAVMHERAGRSVVVSEFLQSVTDVSITGSAQLQAIRESVRVHDISASIAQELKARGIEAEARSDFARKDLGPDQILVSGAVLAGPWDSSRNVWNVLIFVPTLMILGGILPSPLSYRTGAEIHYRVEIEDGEGRILMQTPDRDVIAYYTDYYMWVIPGRRQEAPGELVEEMPGRIAEALAGRLR